MHSYTGKTATFFFNGGFEHSKVYINAKSRETGEMVEVVVDSEDILQVVAYEFVKDQLISAIEDMDYKTLLTHPQAFKRIGD